MNSISIEFARVHPSLTKNGRRRNHWRTQRRATREMREDALFLILRELTGDDNPQRLVGITDIPLWESASIHVHHNWSNVPMDFDGLASSMAPAIDAFIDCGVIEDDSPKFIVSYTMTSEKVSTRAQSGFIVTVEQES